MILVLALQMSPTIVFTCFWPILYRSSRWPTRTEKWSSNCGVAKQLVKRRRLRWSRSKANERLVLFEIFPLKTRRQKILSYKIMEKFSLRRSWWDTALLFYSSACVVHHRISVSYTFRSAREPSRFAENTPCVPLVWLFYKALVQVVRTDLKIYPFDIESNEVVQLSRKLDGKRKTVDLRSKYEVADGPAASYPLLKSGSEI